MLMVYLQPWLTNRRVDSWAKKRKLFFVLAIGRSGTSFLAHLLSSPAGTHVFHEPVGEDAAAYLEAFHEPAAAFRYIHRFRKKEIYLRARPLEPETYGEVNSLLRRHAPALSHAFPAATIVHLVRDGRDVVRSMSARRTMRPADKNTRGIRPHEDDPLAASWETMDRFARLCWYWKTENAYLREHTERTVQFEALLSSYDYLQEKLLRPLKIELPCTLWERATSRPKNVTEEHALPPWSAWSHDRQETFKAICADEMKEYGYEL